jgi:alpha-beta hydrolase superfamily lysophospholipase
MRKYSPNRSAWAVAAAALALVACAPLAPQPPRQEPPLAEAAPQPVACPKDVPTGTRCLAGKDSAGAHYLIAVPATWNRRLVLHAHGGPVLGEPRMERALGDLTRWNIMVKAGYAWAGSTFRQGGVAVRAAAEDTERLRRIFVQHVAAPERTVLHGQSWGAGVAAKGAEMFTRTATGKPPYDAVLLTSGVLGGGTRSYDFRLDLRVVYQYLCNNHPRPDEPAYPLWMGLPADSPMKQADLAQRTRECLGLGLPAAQRTPEQARKLKTIVDVIRIPERNVQGHLNWATFHFRDIAQQRTGGGNVFGNIGAVYTGSPDDAALNAGVLRYAADPAAVARFGADTDPTGKISVPVLTLHAVHDPVAFVELESHFRATMQAAGAGERLVQVFADESEHSYLNDPLYPALLQALLAWSDGGAKPTPDAVAASCDTLQATFGKGCRVLPGYTPPPLDTRVVVRQRP